MIHIMSFNIRTASANDGRNCWDNRKQLVVDRIRAFSPDLLGLQECRNDAQAEFLKGSLVDYYFIGFERGGDDDTAIEMSPILIKKPAFDLVEKGCFWLSETPEQPGSTSWGSIFPRIVTWAKLKPKCEREGILYFFNTHFDYANLPVQVKSAALLCKHIASLENTPPLIICGDFNAEKESPPYWTFLAANAACPTGLQDCYRQVNPHPWNDEGTFHNFGALETPSGLDWILASSHFHIVETCIDRYEHGDIYPSDHYPLTCRCALWADLNPGKT